MAYDSPIFLEIIQPMRQELTQVGFEEVRSSEAVDAALSRGGTTMVVVNSICGCAAGIARPAVAEALGDAPRPDHLITVFAGQDVEATKRAREYFTGYPPSSPSVALMQNGELKYMMERHQIEGHTVSDVANALRAALQQICG